MNEDLRYRVKQLANEQLVMQEALHDLPLSEIRAHMKLMEQHAIKLSNSHLACMAMSTSGEYVEKMRYRSPSLPNRCRH
jgi:hypothetical protein